MTRATDISDTDRAAVSAAVQRTEARTSAEIVPVVTSASGRYDRGEDMAGVVLAGLAFTVVWVLFQREDPTAGGWGGLPLTLQLPILLAILAGGFAVGSFVASRAAWLRRLFTARSAMHDEACARAAQMFFDRRIHHTAAATGVLIFVSLFERQAVVLADRAAFEALGQERLDAACAKLTAALRNTTVAKALEQTIGDLGDHLAEALPADGADRNEHGNALIVID